MSLQSVPSQRVERSEPIKKETPSIWNGVMNQWLSITGLSPGFVYQLIEQEELFHKLGIHYEWFEGALSPTLSVVGLKVYLPFQEVVTYFQECLRDEVGIRHYSWHEVSEHLYESVKLKIYFSNHLR